MAAALPKILNSKPFFWVVLAAPALVLLPRYLRQDVYLPDDLIAPTGTWSARLIIAALMLTPLSLLFRGRGWIQWLVRRRRAFGVAAFAYALLHLAFYLIDMQALESALAEALALGIWTGWAAFVLLVPLALTSNDGAVRALKSGWKRLQRLAYPAALLTLLHWMFVHDDRTTALLHFAPLALLEAWRLSRSLRGHRAAPTQPAYNSGESR